MQNIRNKKVLSAVLFAFVLFYSVDSSAIFSDAVTNSVRTEKTTPKVQTKVVVKKSAPTATNNTESKGYVAKKVKIDGDQLDSASDSKDIEEEVVQTAQPELMDEDVGTETHAVQVDEDLAGQPASEDTLSDQEQQDKPIVEKINLIDKNFGSQDVVTPSQGTSKQVLNTLLQNDFPEKTDFIKKEDGKITTTVLKTTHKATAPKTPVANTPNTKAISLKPASVPSATSFLDDAQEDLDMSSMMTRMGVTILILTVVVFLMAYVWKYLQSKSGSGGMFKGSNQPLKVLAQQMIGPKSKVIIVEAMGKRYLVGATESSIHLLADMDFFGEADDVTPGSFDDNLRNTLQAKVEEDLPTPKGLETKKRPVKKKVEPKAMMGQTLAEKLFEREQQDKKLSVSKADAKHRIKERLKNLKKLA